MTGLPSEHEHYEELCALATAGALTAEESALLLEHLGECTACSHHFAEYQCLANAAAAMLPGLRPQRPEAAAFDESQALDRLLKDLEAVIEDA